MKTLRNPQRFGGLGQITDSARDKLLGVACFECDVVYSQTTFIRGHPAIRCPGCNKRGYMIRDAREGGRLIWERANKSHT